MVAGQAILVHFHQEGGLLLDFHGDGDDQCYLDAVLAQIACLGIEIEVDVRLPLLEKDLGRVRRLEGNVLDVDALQRELGSFLFGLTCDLGFVTLVSTQLGPRNTSSSTTVPV